MISSYSESKALIKLMDTYVPKQSKHNFNKFYQNPVGNEIFKCNLLFTFGGKKTSKSCITCGWDTWKRERYFILGKSIVFQAIYRRKYQYFNMWRVFPGATVRCYIHTVAPSKNVVHYTDLCNSLGTHDQITKKYLNK